jgi:cell division protein FtsX
MIFQLIIYKLQAFAFVAVVTITSTLVCRIACCWRNKARASNVADPVG